MTLKRTAPLVLMTAAALSMTACAQSERDSGDGGGGSSDVKDTLTFGAAGAPELFDPLYATDGETFRVTRQIHQGLLGIKPGTADVQPELAESWEPSDDGLSWTFHLRQGVKFSDGTDFDADAVCYNMERMYNQKGAGQTAAEYWTYFFGTFSDDPEGSLYKSCEAKDADTAVIDVTRTTSSFPTILSLDSFSMQSPTALEEGDANNVQAQGEGFTYPEYSMNPVGIGPYKLDSYDEANKTVTLVANDDYYGDPPKTKTLVFKIIPDETTRRQELEAGSIDGYDLPNPVDWQGLEDDGNNVQVRPAFNVLYLGLNPEKNPKLKDLRVRQAIAYALNREQMVTSQLPEGASVASQFMPEAVSGYNKDLEPYPYDPDKAKQLLKEAGAEGMSLTFAFPTEVSRPYMPDPQKIHAAFTKDLEAVGIKVKEVSKPWNGGYLDDVSANGAYDAWLLGWTGDYNAADNFLGTFFSDLKGNDFHTSVMPWGKTLSEDLKAADAIVDEDERAAAYEDINKRIAEEYLPGIPISHSPPALVTSEKVEGLVASPLTAETFDTVTVAK
ncbi:ABC transporter substrate-binding protein [Phycicoccus endophyticus]|uniref:ABC transporter substrate-binding protein n=1 Tax=Phycicoccus endophyticus TaxID=1690220 RepID=A0A7G9QZ11_9MICO|nr:ABC transporter substrate-binding protein [Phycicoccus endophyticus]NHI18925.1 ABC transporter substrate-binding protein [Phycicoccus endophyticus]QNN48586.1 ABC transporter substrate-binding protein [Phycicoccus endophyticus]GGL31413.1 ABC transporter substrate-binding protein [Phycicoccus endophyticus]